MLGTSNNGNIIPFNNKIKSSEYFYDLYNVVFDGISENMELLLQTGKYGGAIRRTDPKTMVYFIVKFLSNTVTSQEDNTIDGREFKEGELAVKYAYFISMKSKTNSYW